MSVNDLDKLIIEHLAALDESAKRLEDIGENVASTMDDLAEKWAQKHRWHGVFDLWRDELSLAPTEWIERTQGDRKWKAWFIFDFGYGDSGKGGGIEDYFWLTRLCGARDGQLGFRFDHDQSSNRLWKQFLRSYGRLPAFIRDDRPSFFLPVRVDASELAEAVRSGNIESALGNFEKALADLKAALPAFRTLIRDFEKASKTKL